jgi:hypothetical protein
VRLLRKITDYATVNMNATATHSAGDEIGDRIPIHIEEGSVSFVVFEISYSEILNGTDRLYGYVTDVGTTPSGNTDLGNSNGLVVWNLPGNQAGVGHEINDANDTKNTLNTYDSVDLPSYFCFASGPADDTLHGARVLPGSYFAATLGASTSTAGIYSINVYLYGTPRMYGEYPSVGGTTTSVLHKP